MLGPGGKVSTNIKLMITAISSALGEVGASPDAEQKWGWLGKYKIWKGRQAIMGVGKDLKDISDVVVAVASIEDMGPIKTKIGQMLGAMPSIIAEVAPAFNKAKRSQKTVLAQLAELNEPMQVILDFMSRAAESKIDGKSGSKLGKSIATLFDEIAKATKNDALSMDSMQPIIDFVSALSQYQDPLANLADSFEKLATNMDKFVIAYKGMDQKSMDKHKLLIDSLVVFSEVDPGALNAVSDKGKQLLDYINGGGPKEPPVLPAGGIGKSPAGGTKQSGTKDVNDTEAKQGTMDTAAMVQLLGDIKTAVLGVKTALNCVKVKNDGSFSQD